MIVLKSKYNELEKKYENLLSEFVKYKKLYNYYNCNNAWKYDQLMARTVKLKRENTENTCDKTQIEKLSKKLSNVMEERDYLKSKAGKIIQDEINKRVNEEVNLVFRKNAKINEELLQSKEELKWVMWYLKSLKEIYLSENNSSTKRVILDKLKEGIPECYRDIVEDILSSKNFKQNTFFSRIH